MAQFRLAICYRDGEGVATNYVEVVTWFRKAAEQNLAEAQCGFTVTREAAAWRRMRWKG